MKPENTRVDVARWRNALVRDRTGNYRSKLAAAGLAIVAIACTGGFLSGMKKLEFALFPDQTQEQTLDTDDAPRLSGVSSPSPQPAAPSAAAAGETIPFRGKDSAQTRVTAAMQQAGVPVLGVNKLGQGHVRPNTVEELVTVLDQRTADYIAKKQISVAVGAATVKCSAFTTLTSLVSPDMARIAVEQIEQRFAAQDMTVAAALCQQETIGVFQPGTTVLYQFKAS